MSHGTVPRKNFLTPVEKKEFIHHVKLILTQKANKADELYDPVNNFSIENGEASLQGDNITFYVTCTDSQTGLLSTLSATSANCPPVDSLVNPSGDSIAQQAFNWYDPTTLVGINSQRIAQLDTAVEIMCTLAVRRT